jgi:hypothetical protein
MAGAVANLIRTQLGVAEAQLMYDKAIYDAAQAGLSTREIGLCLGLSHAAIVKRLNKLRSKPDPPKRGNPR